MKTIIFESASPLSWYFIPDSALVNVGKPFFIPEFAEEFEAILAPVIRINRLGKSISSRFAERYYAEIAPGIHFRASELRKELLGKGLPPDPAQSFDRALTVGEFIPFCKLSEDSKFKLILKRHDSKAEEAEEVIDLKEIRRASASVIETVSATNTLKMGDYILPVLSGGVKIKIGDILKVYLDDAPMFFIDVK